MTPTQTQLKWEGQALSKFNLMVSKIPIFHREIVRQIVPKKAEINALQRKGATIEEDDVVKAFLSEVPKAFYSLMIRIMDEVGFDHKKYEK